VVPPVLIWREAIQHTQVEAESFIKHSLEATEQKEKIPQTPWCNDENASRKKEAHAGSWE
jgi:hypothetical protein